MTDDEQEIGARLRAALGAHADAAMTAGSGRDGGPARAAEPSYPDVVHLDSIRPVPPRRRRWAVAASGAAVAASIAAITITIVSSGTRSGMPSPASAGASSVASPSVSSSLDGVELLSGSDGRAAVRALAAVRARAADPVVGAGQYLLQRIAGPDGVLRTWAPGTPTDFWVHEVARKGSTVRISVGPCERSVGNQCVQTGGFDDVPPALVSALPTEDAGSAYRLLRAFGADKTGRPNTANVAGVVDVATMVTADSVLLTGALPVAKQASVIAALARLPGLQVFRNVPTSSGRVGLGVQVPATSHLSTLPNGIILDPRTGAVIGDYAGSPVGSSYQPETVTYAVVDSAPQLTRRQQIGVVAKPHGLLGRYPDLSVVLGSRGTGSPMSTVPPSSAEQSGTPSISAPSLNSEVPSRSTAGRPRVSELLIPPRTTGTSTH